MKRYLSIIIPFYNASNYLHLPINSLKNQTYTDFEVILVNDGSTDNSYEVAQDLINGDPRFIVLNQQNAGPGAARNLGISAAKSKYIGFLDSDDYFHEDYVKLTTEKALADKADIVICEILKVDEQGNVVKHYPISYNKPIGRMEAFADIMQSKNISSITQNKIFKKELFYNVEFPINIKVSEDSATVYKLILNSDKISFVNFPLCNYVQRAGSSMNSFNYSKLTDRFQVSDMIKKHMFENGLSGFMYLHDIYYLKSVVLSGALQIAIFSDNYSKDINRFISNVDKNIFSLANIIKLVGNDTKKSFALLALKLNPFLFRLISLSGVGRK